MLKLYFIGIIALFTQLHVSEPSQPEKKMTIQVTQQEATLLFNALNDCDCPQRSAAELREKIALEYQKTWPAPVPPKPDTTKKP